jgi:Ca-activated chloride channel family protein
MSATDADPTRLGAAQKELERLIDSMRGNRFGLVLFAGSSILRSPLTTDSQAMIELVQRANAEAGLTRVGSDIGGALDQAGRVLEASDSAGKAVIVVSDGEDHTGAYADKASALREKGIVIFAAGAGTPQGATLTEMDPRTRLPRQKLDPSGRVIISRLTEGPLRTVAQNGGGRYLRLGDDPDGLLTLREDFAGLQQTPIGEQTQRIPIERFQLFAGAALVLLVLSLLLPARLRIPFRLPRPRTAALPRPGVALFLLALLLGACGGDSLRDQNAAANDLFESGDFEAALSAYQELLAQRPDVPELGYNAGNTLHRLESYERAIEETQRALPPSDSKLGAQTYYALGNHLLALQRFEPAYEAYRSALLLDPDDADAKHNLELALVGMLQEQQQQEQQPPGAGEQPQPQPEPGEQPQEEPPGPPAPGPQQPGTQTPDGQPPVDPVRELQEALRGIDEEVTFEEAIRILDLLREQQQRQRQDASPGPSSGPDY